MESQELTQPSTQQFFDPRRLGRNNSGLNETDISDVLCILHPSSSAAIRIVEYTARHKPQHILENPNAPASDQDGVPLDERDTVILDENGRAKPKAPGGVIALRFSSRTELPYLGFVFGRNAQLSDIVFSIDTVKRVSNQHFRIYLTENGVLMLEDMSTNGTLVDQVHLRKKGGPSPSGATRMLNNGSIIEILSTVQDEHVKFILQIPNRKEYEEEFEANCVQYLKRVRESAEKAAKEDKNRKIPQNANGATDHGYTSKKGLLTGAYNTFGMAWNGDGIYNVVGLLGKGAFATVYRIATAMDGKLLAAKELEKKRFMKNGQLDQRLDNEMQIMQTIHHPNIVQYIDYKDVGKHLYIIMEYIPCGDLQGWLSKNGPLPEKKAQAMARQVLHALAYLHQKKITHRDIKPDNLLIASEDPFVVKLTDFGLSKVVKNNETFLKTFCGTLLYCAPEVFPHYPNYVKGQKRRRGASSRPSFHSYSQSVDIWSFAAVLWYALCCKPPFEGVVDNTGRGMFDRIMSTDVDPTPLKEAGVSDLAIDFLCTMLKTDPAERPTEQSCLRHPWIADDEIIPDYFDPSLESIDESIEEEEFAGFDDEIEDVENEVTQAAAEEGFSQLSLRENGAPTLQPEEGDYDDIEASSEDLDFLLEHNRSKRVKVDPQHPRNQIRDNDELESSLEIDLPDTTMVTRNFGDSMTIPAPVPGKPRLFGEIGRSALQSSGILGEQTNRALALEESSDSVEPEDSAPLQPNAVPGHNLVGVQSAASLLGAESVLRELNMSSPASVPSESATVASAAATPNETNEPTTPKTPDVQQTHSFQAAVSSSSKDDETPKARVSHQASRSFIRQIDLPKTASFYFDPYKPETHTAEYASKISGINFIKRGTSGSSEASIILPDTMNPIRAATESKDSQDAQPEGDIEDPREVLPPQTIPAVDDETFVRPRPRLGRLTTTPDSFINLEIKLEQPWTSFGRHSSCTVVYSNKADTRVAKKVFEIWFHHEQLETYKNSGKDWTKLKGLYTGITTFSRYGLWVNGVQLMEKAANGRMQYGKLCSGDVITVVQGDSKSAGLKFLVELFKGDGVERRKTEERFTVFEEGAKGEKA
jgi:serine/threonine protein kinase